MEYLREDFTTLFPKMPTSSCFCLWKVLGLRVDDPAVMWLLWAAGMPRSKFVYVNLPGVRESVTMLLLSACSWSFNAGEAAFRSEGGFCFACRVETFIPESVNSCHLLLCSREFMWGGEVEGGPSLHPFLRVLKPQREEMTSVRTCNI